MLQGATLPDKTAMFLPQLFSSFACELGLELQKGKRASLESGDQNKTGVARMQLPASLFHGQGAPPSLKKESGPRERKSPSSL